MQVLGNEELTYAVEAHGEQPEARLVLHTREQQRRLLGIALREGVAQGPGLDLGGARHELVDLPDIDGRPLAEDRGHLLQLGIEVYGRLADEVNQLFGAALGDDPVAQGEVAHLGGQVFPALGGAVDDRLLSHLRDRLVQARVLCELGGLKAQNRRLARRSQIRDDGFARRLGHLVCVAHHHQAVVAAKRQRVARSDERVGVGRGTLEHLAVEVEVPELRYLLVEALDDELPLELVGSDDEIGRQECR